MNLSRAGLALLLAAVAVESFAQLFLKLGASRLRPAGLRRAWTAAGAAAYVLEIALYTLALRRVDVSVAFPVGSLCFAGVAVLSKLFLGEAVNRTRWLGILCLTAGAVVVTL